MVRPASSSWFLVFDVVGLSGIGCLRGASPWSEITLGPKCDAGYECVFLRQSAALWASGPRIGSTFVIQIAFGDSIPKA
jgi:hypothetical protein